MEREGNANISGKADVEGKINQNACFVVQHLKDMYMQRLLPLELEFHFAHFHGVPIRPSELEAKPQVLLVGQYSTGKTTMVKWFLGIREQNQFFDIRPQPSTDRFVAIVHGEEERVISGDAATLIPELPYVGLTTFGSALLAKFQVLVEPAPLLEHISFVDTPGVLSGEKQRISRNYDFVEVTKWFAQRSDMILLVFDAHKLDISDEFKEVIVALKGNEEKIRCVLNKADEISGENLVKVYGALMWNLGKILCTPEVAKVHVGSFWDEPYKERDLGQLLDSDRGGLLSQLHDLPKNVAVRRVNDVVARARALKVHMALVGHIRQSLPLIAICGRRQREQLWISRHLDKVYQDIIKAHGFFPGDLPEQRQFRQQLEQFPDFSRFPKWDDAKAADLARLIDVDVPELMRRIGGISASNLGTTPRQLDPLEHTSSSPVAERRMPFITAMGVAVAVAVLAILVAMAGPTSHPHSPPQVDRDFSDIFTSYREFAFGLARPFAGALTRTTLAPLPSAPEAPPLQDVDPPMMIEKFRGWWAARLGFAHSVEVQACEPNCNLCSSSTTCTECKNNMYLHNETCVAACPAGYYGSETAWSGRACKACGTDCNLCSSSTICAQCKNSKYLSNDTCVTTCPAGYYGSGWGTTGRTCGTSLLAIAVPW